MFLFSMLFDNDLWFQKGKWMENTFSPPAHKEGGQKAPATTWHRKFSIIPFNIWTGPSIIQENVNSRKRFKLSIKDAKVGLCGQLCPALRALPIREVPPHILSNIRYNSIIRMIVIMTIVIIIMMIIYGICKTFLEMKTYNILPIRESPSHPLSNFQHL